LQRKSQALHFAYRFAPLTICSNASTISQQILKKIAEEIKHD
jgi:hypothetical protein